MIAKPDLIEGAVKAFAVLESFDAHRQRLNASQAAERAGLSRAAARRHLLTLEHMGYLESQDGVYWLSPRVLKLSGSYLASARLPRTVQPVLNRLSALTGQAFSVAIRDAEEMVIIARSSAADRERLMVAHGLHLGARLSLTATSTGRVMLAALSDAESEQWKREASLPRLTMHTVTDWARFEVILNDIRTNDYSWVVQEHELGVQALAVPLRNLSGHTVAALNVVLPVKDHPAARTIRTLLPLMQEAARELMPLIQ